MLASYLERNWNNSRNEEN
jgi:hypothetical protein